MGRKLVREDELYKQGGLLSFPRTGCALLRCENISMVCHDISRRTNIFLGCEGILSRSLQGLRAEKSGLAEGEDQIGSNG
jgi:hypothetical protein